MKKPAARKEHAETAVAGTAAGESAKLVGDNVVFHASKGHGFAAEKANHLRDVLGGEQARHEGMDFRKYGADRVVNGAQIQTKYCRTGAACIAECFGGSQEFLYWTEHGTPMQIEVPSDKWEDAVKVMAERIKKGQVVLRKDGKVLAAVTDPREAASLVRRGHVSYDSAQAIARFGTIEGLVFDAANGIQLAGSAAGISAAVSYAAAIWNGEDGEKAIEAACHAGLKVGGVAWISSVTAAQLGRTGIEQALRPATQALVARMGSETTRWLAAGSGRDLAGSAANNYVGKLMRGNVVAAIATTVVMSTADLFRMFEGRISFAQLFKNVASTAAGVTGGMSGASAGAAQGAAWGSAIPGPGTLIGMVVGGLLGGLAGGTVASASARFVLDGLIEDDAKEMLQILQRVYAGMAQRYFLSAQEAQAVLASLQERDLPSALRDMYGADQREAFAEKLLQPLIDAQLGGRARITLPSDDALLAATERLLLSASGTDTAPVVVHNRERSLHMAIPRSWTLLEQIDTPMGFPSYALPGGSVRAYAVATPLSKLFNLDHLARHFHDAQQKAAATVAVSAIEEVVAGDLHGYRYRVDVREGSGQGRIKLTTVLQAAHYALVLHVLADSEASLDEHWTDLEAWIGSAGIATMGSAPSAHETVVTDDAGLVRMLLLPGWTPVPRRETDSSPAQVLRLESTLPVDVVVSVFEPDGERTLEEMAQFFTDAMATSLPGSMSSIRHRRINGRDATICHVRAEIDGNPWHCLQTILDFDDQIVMLQAQIYGDDPTRHLTQCEALAWRVFSAE
jgi:hypothetical protein